MKTEIQLPDLKEIEFQLQTTEVDIIQGFVKKIEYPNCYVEIGTKFGGSALVAKLANSETDIYSIDPNSELWMWKGKEHKYKGLHFIKKLSLSAAKNWKKPIEVLFIDGDHNMAKDDFLAWEPYVVKNGIILFHDYAVHSPKVIKDCDELFLTNPNYEILFIPPVKSRIDTSIFQVKKLK